MYCPWLPKFPSTLRVVFAHHQQLDSSRLPVPELNFARYPYLYVHRTLYRRRFHVGTENLTRTYISNVPACTSIEALLGFALDLSHIICLHHEKLARLHAKLNLTVLPDELEEAGWDYGAPLADIKRLVERWKSGFDWRAQERALNSELPQFTRDIDVEGHGVLNIHYVHKRSAVEGAIPLLFVHGWPGSFVEVGKILPLLTASSAEHPSFHVVAFSLPGFGFSEAPREVGFNAAQYAEVGNKLMLALGYNEYVTQGGDWGYMVTRKIALLYGGKTSKAWHTNFPLCTAPQLLRNPLSYFTHLVRPYNAAEKAGMERTNWFIRSGKGYSAEQSTQPQTLGYSLADSPVGLLAWIYEKLVRWTDNYPWDDDEVLTWVSMYWFSRSGPAATLRIYYEMQKPGGRTDMLATPPSIPMGVSYFPKELYGHPRSWMRAAGNVVYMKEHDKGGHFAAHEVPEVLVSDVREMFGKGGAAYGVVPGHSGY